MPEATYQVTRCDQRGETIQGNVPAYMSFIVAVIIDRIGNFTSHIYHDPHTGNFYKIERAQAT